MKANKVCIILNFVAVLLLYTASLLQLLSDDVNYVLGGVYFVIGCINLWFVWKCWKKEKDDNS